MTLTHETVGTGRPATFVHGFTQTRSSWNPVMRLLTDVRATLVDAPGHGGSPDGRRSLWECADDIAKVMEAGVLVGYSMGARMALHCALAHPDKVHSLVLISGTPGIRDNDERAARRASDNALADKIESIGVPAFIDEWLANPMFSGLTPETAMRQARLTNTASGLADSLRYAGTGTQDDLWHRLGELSMPVLVVHGENDPKFASIASDMHAAVPGSSLVCVANVGHTVHLEDTATFAKALMSWLVTTAR